METQAAALRETMPRFRPSNAMRRSDWLAGQRQVITFDGSNDPEVCCIICGAFLGQNSTKWWDDYICVFCHDRN